MTWCCKGSVTTGWNPSLKSPGSYLGLGGAGSSNLNNDVSTNALNHRLTQSPSSHACTNMQNIPVVPRKAVAEVSVIGGEVSCCDAWMAERIHLWTERWSELCLLNWLQRSPQPQLLDVVWCSVVQYRCSCSCRCSCGCIVYSVGVVVAVVAVVVVVVVMM